MLLFQGQVCFLTVLCWLRASAADIETCQDAVCPQKGRALLQSKSHLDTSRGQDLSVETFVGGWGQASMLRELGVNSSLNKLAAQCRNSKTKPPVPLAVAEQLRKVHNAEQERRSDSCPGELTLWHFFHNRTATSCCPMESTDCGGCANFSAGTCQECDTGFIRQNDRCVACLSTIDWVNEKGDSCEALKSADCNDRPVNGQSSNQACCKCQGGHKSPTPFKYADTRFVLGGAIHLQPLPRTATRYSLDAGCSLSAFNLTMDGSTGVISNVASMDRPVKPFSVQCEVTAHQGVGLSETVKVIVAADYMTYSSPALVFSEEVTTYSLSTAVGSWTDYKMICAPEQPWLSLDQSGTLSSAANAASAANKLGGLTEVAGTYTGMDGGVCVVSAMQTGAEGNATKRTTTFAAIKPRPWPELEYESSYAEVVIGEELPPLKLKTPAGYEDGMGGLRPTSFVVACSVDITLNNRPNPSWSFDRNWGVGLLENHQILEVSPDGSIALVPGESMAKLFDEFMAYQRHRKVVEMHCGVYGLFPGTDFQPLSTKMIFRIKDSMCWIEETFSGEVVHQEKRYEEASCRNGCRLSKVCSHFTFNQSEDSCKHYRVNNVDGSPLTAYAKVTDCTDLGTCLRLKHPEWIIAGDYCPVDYDIRRGMPVYRKDSPILQEVLYLATVPEGSSSGCAVGNWLVQQAAPGLDYVDPKLGYFELAGEERVCLDVGLPSTKAVVFNKLSFNISLDWATLACPKPLIPEVEEEQLQPIVFDDPTTLQPDDFWLHPCDCVPPEWGMGYPANPMVVEGLPAGSDGTFIPPPLLIVQGQFACPSRQLLSGKRGIYFETEAEAFESADCMERCKDFADCTFYWTGTSHGAQTCRLFNGCDSLVREFGMDGDLFAMPQNKSCLVANPEVCWKTTLRRQFLTQKESVSPSFTHASALFNSGGLADFHNNASRTLDRELVYEEKLGDISSVKLLGFTEIFHPMGYVRSLGGLASATVQGLNPKQEYDWTLLTQSNQKQAAHKVAVNHGPQMTVQQPEGSHLQVLKQGRSTSTPRGELVFDFEASEFSLAPQDLRSGATSSTATMTCPTGTQMTHCSCFSDSGICAGAKMEPSSNPKTCRAYGSREVSGWSTKSVSVRAHARCMRLKYLRNMQVVTSSIASFSFLQSLEAVESNSTEPAELADLEDDEGDVEVSLDADGHAREEDFEHSDDMTESEGHDEEVPEEGAEETKEETDSEGEDEDGALEEDEDDEMLPFNSQQGVAAVEEGAESVSSAQSWRRRRRRRRRRARRRRSRRRRSRRRRSRRRRTLPAEVTASCPSGKKLLSCSCYPDSFLEKQTVWTDVRHHCKRTWRVGNSCRSRGGYAQALCGDLEDPAARAWTDVAAEGHYHSNKEEGPTASCPGNTILIGCWCESFSGAQKDCARVYTSGNQCLGRTGPGRVHTFYGKIKITARCADIRSSALILSGINLTRVAKPSLIQDTVAAENVTVPFPPKSFRYMHLFQQCDALLLMGGIGVEHCSRPSYRVTTSHSWQGKRPLPVSLVHGSQLSVGCWTERYQAFRASTLHTKETLHCVNGDWYNSLQLPQLTGFVCEPCVLVGGKGYAKYESRNQQELYYFSRMSMRVYTELGALAATVGAAQKYCLAKDYLANAKNSPSPTAGGKMILDASAACPEVLAIEVVGSAEIEERMLALLDYGMPDNNQCLEAVPAADEVSPSLVHRTCDLENQHQLISPMAIPGIMWSMHKEADRTSGDDFHKAFGSYCGAHGALASLAFGQIFGGDTDGLLSQCHFAPVIKFGEFLDTGITYDKRSPNWPDWNTLLADSPILCADGEALTGFRLLPARNVFRYECSRIGGLGASYEYFSAQVEVKKFDQYRSNWINALRMIKVDCGSNGLLSGFHFEFSEGGRWARSKFTCSKAGGAPVVMEPSTTIESMSHMSEGVFCPAEPDAHSGRYKYLNAATGDTLTFERDGKWCVGPDCSAAVGGPNPVGVTMSLFEVMNVSDFDGHFEAKGVPKMEGGGMDDLMKKLKAIKPPKRPEQPPKPKLEEFKAEMPKYANECLDYQDLWNKITETHKNSDNEEVVEESKLNPDEGTVDAERPDYHPCSVAASVGGIFGRLAGQSGARAPHNMLYKDWVDCMNGDINRDWLAAKHQFGNSLYHTIANAVQEGIKLVCAAVPNVEIAPLGAGVESRPPNICGEVVDFVRTIVDLGPDITKASMDRNIERESYNACNPFEVGFSRLFCDVHCVRDAVIRGDRTILRNLEQATKISNDNMKKMVEWSTEATRTETEYLDKKIDHSLKINTIYLHHIAQNTQPKEEELFQSAAAATGSMLGELQGFAETSSVGISRVTARDALERFVATAQPLADGNLSSQRGQVQKFQAQMASLYETMRASAAGTTRAQAVGRQTAREAQVLQARVSRQAQVLGIYRAHSRAAHQAAKSWKRSGAESTLVNLDSLWWRLRGKLDRYLDVAGDEISQFQHAFSALTDYQKCKAGTVDLLQSYRASMKVMQRSHGQLRATWRDTVNLVGELAAIIRDGDVFGHLMKAEGCGSGLAAQTLDQTRFALQAMGFLIHRFQVSDLPEPDVSVLQEAVKYIHEAYSSARSFCKEDARGYVSL